MRGTRLLLSGAAWANRPSDGHRRPDATRDGGAAGHHQVATAMRDAAER